MPPGLGVGNSGKICEQYAISGTRKLDTLLDHDILFIRVTDAESEVQKTVRVQFKKTYRLTHLVQGSLVTTLCRFQRGVAKTCVLQSAVYFNCWFTNDFNVDLFNSICIWSSKSRSPFNKKSTAKQHELNMFLRVQLYTFNFRLTVLLSGSRLTSTPGKNGSPKNKPLRTKDQSFPGCGCYFGRQTNSVKALIATLNV